MATTSKSPTHENMPESGSPANLDGSKGRLIFLGPKETIRKLRSRPLAPLGQEVTRQEIKELTIEYVRRVTNASAMLDTEKEPMTLLIEREDIEALLSDSRCTRIVALLAVETKEDHNKPHQTFVLMPCDDSGRLVGASTDDETGAMERWPIIRSVASIRKNGDIDYDVETFLQEEFHI